MKELKEIVIDLIAAGIAGMVGEGVGKTLRYLDKKRTGEAFDSEEDSNDETENP